MKTNIGMLAAIGILTLVAGAQVKSAPKFSSGLFIGQRRWTADHW